MRTNLFEGRMTPTLPERGGHGFAAGQDWGVPLGWGWTRNGYWRVEDWERAADQTESALTKNQSQMSENKKESWHSLWWGFSLNQCSKPSLPSGEPPLTRQTPCRSGSSSHTEFMTIIYFLLPGLSFPRSSYLIKVGLVVVCTKALSMLNSALTQQTVTKK